MLDVRLFGTGRASYQDQVLAGFPGRQCYLLLCYLLLNRRHAHERDRLAAMFWGDSPTPVARKHLRNALWRLRSSLAEAGLPVDDFLQIHDDGVAVACANLVQLDVEVFETAMTELQDLPGQLLTPAQTERLAQAADLYTGELLEGIDAEWCLCDRERLGLLHLTALRKLMLFYESQGAFEHGLAYGERILAIDNTRERVYRDMMRLYWLAGDRSAALEEYQRCAQVLHEELGVAPMPATRLLYQQMLHNEFLPHERLAVVTDGVSAPAQSPDASYTAAEYALQRLHDLQTIIHETSHELQSIEELIQHALLDEHTA